MASPARQVHGFTLLELIVVIVVIGILASLAVPSVSSGRPHGHAIQTLSNARQIHLATMSMVADGLNTNDPGLGWPGDLKAKGRITTLADYVNLLVRYDYLKPGDLKVFSAFGYKAYPGGSLSSGSNGGLSPAFTEEYSAFKMYLVKEVDPKETLFLASKNFTYKEMPKPGIFEKSSDIFWGIKNGNLGANAPKTQPFEGKFVVLRKGGDASIYNKIHLQSIQGLKAIGSLPCGGTVERAEDCLNPSARESEEGQAARL